MPMDKEQLTPKQRKIAAEYFILSVSPDCADPIAESAKRAGYSAKSAYAAGSRVLNMDKVKAELARLGAEAAARFNVTVDQLLRMFFNVHDLALEGTPIMNRHNEPVMRDGEPLIKRDLTNANKATENIAKMTGHMIEKRDVVTRRHLDDMDESELREEEAKVQAEIDKLQKADGKVVELRPVEGGNDGDAA